MSPLGRYIPPPIPVLGVQKASTLDKILDAGVRDSEVFRRDAGRVLAFFPKGGWVGLDGEFCGDVGTHPIPRGTYSSIVLIGLCVKPR